MSWIDGVKRMLGIEPPSEHEHEQDTELEDAKRRVAAIDIRVGVLSRRLASHEGRKDAHS